MPWTREDRIKKQESAPAVPLVTRDGTRITSENKENQDTWEYFINNVYNKTSQYNDTLGTPVYTLYLAWLEETYGQNKLERLWAWLDQAISQIVLGNYEENSTVTGTVGQVLMGLANLDLPGDIRDLSYDLIHWDTTKEHILQTVLDAAGLLPVIGAVKYGDEASSALKHADEVGEQTAKHGGEVVQIKIGSFTDLPPNAQTAYVGYARNGWKGNFSGQTSGVNAGGIYKNSNKLLPTIDSAGNPITYREFDINAPTPGVGRDAERFVVGSDGSVYYSDSHYGQGKSPTGLPPFIKIE